MIPLSEAAKTLNLSARRLRVLCEQGRIPGAQKITPRLWLVPRKPRISPPAKP